MRGIPVRGRGRWLLLALATLGLLFIFGGTAVALSGDDTPTLTAGIPKDTRDEETQDQPRELDLAPTSAKLAGDPPPDTRQGASPRGRRPGRGGRRRPAQGSAPPPL